MSAESIVFAENEARTDLSPWEWSLAWQQRRERRRDRGQPATVRDVAAAHDKPHTTVGEYLRVADAITPELLAQAGVVAQGGPDHSRMARLPLSALKRVAAATAQGVETAAQHLIRELRRVGDQAARERLQKGEKSARPMSFQINTRRPLGELTPRQASRYLDRISMALPVLTGRAVEEMGAADARELADTLEAAARQLRERG